MKPPKNKPNGGGTDTGGDLIDNPDVKHGFFKRENGVDQVVVCGNFRTLPGATFEVDLSFLDSTTPFTTLTGTAGKSGFVSARTNLPADRKQATPVEVGITASKGGVTKTVSLQLVIKQGAGSGDCAFNA